MAKNRVTSLDLAPLAVQLHTRLAGARVINIYHSSARTYLFKFLARTTSDEDELKKPMLIVENGMRAHLTRYEYSKSPLPNSFAMKLRKHLRGARVERVMQVGVDRMLDIVLTTPQERFHLLLQFFGHGNIILADASLTVLAALKTNRKIISVKDVWTARGLCGDVAPPTSSEVLAAALAEAEPKTPYRQVCAKVSDLPSLLVSAALVHAGVAASARVSSGRLVPGTPAWDAFVDYLRECSVAAEQVRLLCRDTFVTGAEGDFDLRGFVYRNSDGDVAEILPFALPPAAHPLPWTEEVLPSHNDALDTVFKEAEDRRRLATVVAAENRSGDSRLERLRVRMEERLDLLLGAESAALVHAAAIELSMGTVEAVLADMTALVDEFSPLGAVQELQRRRDRHEPLGVCVSEFDPAHLTFLLTLPQPPVDDEGMPVMDIDEDELLSQPLIAVELDLHESMFGNLSIYYQTAAESRAKRLKTESQSVVAVRNVTRAAKANGKAAPVVPEGELRERRKPLWFEKFYWFISSDNYLVLCGRDAPSNESLVRHYLLANDVWIHADIHGAATTIVKNLSPAEIFALAGRQPPPGASRLAKRPIPERTIEEAAEFAVAHSKAWQEGFVARAYWVWGDQVSKVAPTGQFLPQGSFVVRGERNYLARVQPNMGFGLAFRLADDSRPAHAGERKAQAGTPEEEAAALAAAEQAAGARAALGERQRRHALSKALREYGLTAQEWATMEQGEGDEGLVRAVRRRVAELVRAKIDEGSAAAAANDEDEAEEAGEEGKVMEVESESEYSDEDDNNEATNETKTTSGLSAAMRRTVKRLQSQDSSLTFDEAVAQARSILVERQATAAAPTPTTSTKNQPKNQPPTRATEDLSRRGQRHRRTQQRAARREQRAGAMAEANAARRMIASALDVDGIALRGVLGGGSTEGSLASFALTTYGGAGAIEEQTHLLSTPDVSTASHDVADLTDFIDIAVPLYCTICGDVSHHDDSACPYASAILSRRGRAVAADDRVLAALEAEAGIAPAAETADDVTDTITSGQSLLVLTGRPRAEDTILSVIPFSAPWSALQNNKFFFKLRLEPGDMKRGKAAQLARAVFTSSHYEPQTCLPVHKLLVREIPETESVLQILPDVGFVGPAVAREEKALKKAKTAAKKMRREAGK